MPQLHFKFYSPLHFFIKVSMALLVSSINLAANAESTSLESKVCQKDLQIRMVTIKQDNDKYMTVFHKQEESLISGRFDSLTGAQESLVGVQIELEKIGWKCRPADVSFIFE